MGLCLSEEQTPQQRFVQAVHSGLWRQVQNLLHEFPDDIDINGHYFSAYISRNQLKAPALLFCICKLDVDGVKLFLEMGAKVTFKVESPDGVPFATTAFYAACEQRYNFISSQYYSSNPGTELYGTSQFPILDSLVMTESGKFRSASLYDYLDDKTIKDYGYSVLLPWLLAGWCKNVENGADTDTTGADDASGGGGQLLSELQPLMMTILDQPLPEYRKIIVENLLNAACFSLKSKSFLEALFAKEKLAQGSEGIHAVSKSTIIPLMLRGEHLHYKKLPQDDPTWYKDLLEMLLQNSVPDEERDDVDFLSHIVFSRTNFDDWFQQALALLLKYKFRKGIMPALSRASQYQRVESIDRMLDSCAGIKFSIVENDRDVRTVLHSSLLVCLRGYEDANTEFFMQNPDANTQRNLQNQAWKRFCSILHLTEDPTGQIFIDCLRGALNVSVEQLRVRDQENAGACFPVLELFVQEIIPAKYGSAALLEDAFFTRFKTSVLDETLKDMRGANVFGNISLRESVRTLLLLLLKLGFVKGLSMAIATGIVQQFDLDILKILLQHEDADPNYFYAETNDSCFQAYMAIDHIDSQPIEKNHLLVKAAYSAELVEYLLERGADITMEVEIHRAEVRCLVPVWLQVVAAAVENSSDAHMILNALMEAGADMYENMNVLAMQELFLCSLITIDEIHEDSSMLLAGKPAVKVLGNISPEFRPLIDERRRLERTASLLIGAIKNPTAHFDTVSIVRHVNDCRSINVFVKEKGFPLVVACQCKRADAVKAILELKEPNLMARFEIPKRSSDAPSNEEAEQEQEEEAALQDFVQDTLHSMAGGVQLMPQDPMYEVPSPGFPVLSEIIGSGYREELGLNFRVKDNSRHKINGKTILHMALQSFDEEIMSMLLNYASAKGKLSLLLKLVDGDGNSVLSCAAQDGNIAAVKLLLKHSANPLSRNKNGKIPADLTDIVELKDMLLSSTLWNTARDGDVKGVMASLTTHKTDVNGLDAERGWTALHYAAHTNQLAIVTLLLTNGAKSGTLSKRAKGITAASTNSLSGSTANDGDDGDDADSRAFIADQTALHTACMQGHETIVSELLKHMTKEQVDCADANGQTAILLAAKYDRLSCVELLLSHDASPLKICSGSGDSLLHMTCQQSQHLKYISMLQKSQFDMNTTNNNHETALFVAYRQKNLAMMKWLVEHGVDGNIANAKGETVLHVAYLRDKEAAGDGIAEYLVDSHVVRPSKAIFEGALLSLDRSMAAKLVKAGHKITENNVNKNTLVTIVQNGDVNLMHLVFDHGYVFGHGQRSSAAGSTSGSACTGASSSADDHKELFEMAIRGGDLPMTTLMADRGYRVDYSTIGNDALFDCACSRGNLPMLAFLVERGWSPGDDTVNEKGKTLMNAAYQANHTPIAHFLLEKGLCVPEMEVFQLATNRDDAATIQLLARVGLPLDLSKRRTSVLSDAFHRTYTASSSSSSTATTATTAGSKEGAAAMQSTLDCLLGLPGLVPDQESIHMAVHHGDEPRVRRLVEKGADMNALDEKQLTPIVNAYDLGNDGILQYLLNQGAALRAPLLHHSLKDKKLELAAKLVTKGASLYEHDSSKKLPLEYLSEEEKHSLYVQASFPLSTLAHSNHQLWFELIQIDGIPDMNNRVLWHAQKYPELAHTKDGRGRLAIEMATPLNKQHIKSVYMWHGKYRIMDSRPEHVSATCYVFRAFDEADLDESGNPRRVALKLMRVKSQFLREINVRKKGFDSQYVVNIITTYPNLQEISQWREEVHWAQDEAAESGTATTGASGGSSGGSGSAAIQQQQIVLSKQQAESMFCLVMPLADRNMFVAMKQEQWAGRNLAEIVHVFVQLATCIEHMHAKGVLHADLKTLNLIRSDSRWIAIDLDAACRIGVDTVGFKSSTAIMPPEAIYADREANIVEVKSEANRGQSKVPRYDLLLADTSFDAWSLGCILYQMSTSDVRPLFQGGRDDNLSTDTEDEDNLWRLAEWSAELKARKLSKVIDPKVRNLLSQLLAKDPRQRPSISRALAHPAITGKQVARMAGEKAEFDVFLSYRVAADAHHTEKLYHLLTARGLKVWWDKKCLKPGAPWEEGFCAGLINSHTFVCLLSKGAINHPDKAWQNFGELKADSRCDNVFLEHRMALELRGLGFLEKVFPVMIGEVIADATASKGGEGGDGGSGGGVVVYGNFFGGGGRPSAPNVSVRAVEEKLMGHMEREAMGTPLEMNRSVASVLEDILACQGKIVEGEGEAAFADTADAIAHMVRHDEDEAEVVGKDKLQGNSGTISSSQDVKAVGAADAKELEELRRKVQEQFALIQKLKQENMELNANATSNSHAGIVAEKKKENATQQKVLKKGSTGGNKIVPM